MDFTECYEDSVSTVAAAARTGPRKRLRRLIRLGRTVDLADNRGWRAIHEAAAAGRVGCLKDILSAAAMTAGSSSGFQAYVNSTTHEGETACYLAAERGHLPALRLLLKAGADINQQTNDLSCPLFAAVTDSHKDMVQLLLAKGALVDRSHTASCWTCLHQAVYVNNVDIVRILVTQAKLEACDDHEITPLFLAAQYGRRECLEVLVQAGADVNAQARDLATPLFLASQEGHLACVEFLLEHGADANLVCSEDWPQLPIHGAAEFGHLGILKRLVAVTERTCDCGQGQVSPLYHAVENRNTHCVEFLLSEGFSPDAQDCSEILRLYSPLNVALKDRHSSETARMLLAAGAALRKNEWVVVLTKTHPLQLVLEHRWLYPPRFPGDEPVTCGSKRALRPEEFADMWMMALKHPKSACKWLPPLIRAGLNPYLMLQTNILTKAKGSIVNFLLQFVNWSTLSSSSNAILCQRRAEGTWQPLPQFDAIPDLLHLCRLQLRSLTGPDLVLNSGVVKRLPVPTLLHSFLQFKDIQVDNTDFS
ncbi:ankyrin repeat and SOCS box protein 3 isoform X1 [Corythoichthys intestinalis]|uniref:ankyrin repeat and SOCS box protein 3 isoform X1 n=1 Tax=Corythoichthys intestinalis TaxID=161448 RepID=UPI0025A5D1CA|nr:ankyrin repeat and SOCS box protein 3 isoform X1 [Corythoichthys intestinalis]XP_057682124.1 ankyrin repeat and SOCS box protein 3 isoform X1 [Corythoichthys intestinalis]XP_057682125.1 ankyrin repeat and SOCS box protein 3 isoform X1 [Corythoichthys intestinalis]XP_057682126.1 ankyrin repeat and SOCS box protein 3 isoform X1 [Corythoichthys intestinalis]XP_057682127.1 ankyrin repeat and SOCS box protein 3 isoform X1 [Corythoichthys intestinalis]XP_057682128.1 ankyrin repeat and SOCS box pr